MQPHNALTLGDVLRGVGAGKEAEGLGERATVPADQASESDWRRVAPSLTEKQREALVERLNHHRENLGFEVLAWIAPDVPPEAVPVDYNYPVFNSEEVTVEEALVDAGFPELAAAQNEDVLELKVAELSPTLWSRIVGSVSPDERVRLLRELARQPGFAEVVASKDFTEQITARESTE